MIKSAFFVFLIFGGIFMLLRRDTLAATGQPELRRNDTSILKNSQHYMRIARIVIDSAYVKEYYAALREGMEMAVRKEPGVLNLWAVAEKTDPTHITIFEMYDDVEAYQAHIQTAHFKKYKATVQKMVKSLELTDVDPVALESKEKW